MNIRRSIAVVSAAALVAVTAAGCSTFGDLFAEDAVRDPDTNEVIEAGTVDVFDIGPGDCIQDFLADAEYSRLTVVPCDQPHEAEVYFTYTVSETDFPGEEAILTTADEQCYAAFEDFVGVRWEDSRLAYGYLYPNESTWTEYDDREIDCYVYDEDGQVTGSLEGVAS